MVLGIEPPISDDALGRSFLLALFLALFVCPIPSLTYWALTLNKEQMPPRILLRIAKGVGVGILVGSGYGFLVGAIATMAGIIGEGHGGNIHFFLAIAMGLVLGVVSGAFIGLFIRGRATLCHININTDPPHSPAAPGQPADPQE